MAHQEHTQHEHTQPSAKPEMSMNAQMEDMAKKAGTEYAKELAKEGGKQTMDYEKNHGQQQFDDAKAQAEGMWAKYCGCLSS